MATLWITEYSKTGIMNAGRGADTKYPVAQEPAVAVQAVTIDTSSPVAAASSSAFNAATRLVRMISDADCHVRFTDVTASPVSGATTTHQKLASGVPEWRSIDPDSVNGISVFGVAA